MEIVIDRKQVLPCPEPCPLQIYNLLINCWSYQATNRPAFVRIGAFLDQFKKSAKDNTRKARGLKVYRLDLSYWDLPWNIQKSLKSTPLPPLYRTIVNRMERTCTTNRYTLSNCRPRRTIQQSVCPPLCRPGVMWSVTCLHHHPIKWRCSHVSTRHHRLVRPGMGCMCESLWWNSLINLVQSQITSFLCMLLPKTKKRFRL